VGEATDPERVTSVSQQCGRLKANDNIPVAGVWPAHAGSLANFVALGGEAICYPHYSKEGVKQNEYS